MLREYPEAFTSSYEEEAQKPLAWAEERIRPHPNAPGDVVLGAFSAAGDLVGSVGLAVETRAKQKHKALLFGMFVARALLDACIAHARRVASLRQINLTVTATGSRAVRLYEAAGFRSFGVEDEALWVAGVPYTKIHMVLALAQTEAAAARHAS
jgi:RimJ/RimL family protein N-acetyltransferase